MLLQEGKKYFKKMLDKLNIFAYLYIRVVQHDDRRAINHRIQRMDS